jgi:hypothetical protein
MWLADVTQTVHTSGINWESVAVIAGVILAIITAVTGWIGHQITNAVSDLSEKLELKLESKDKVSTIDLRLTQVEQVLKDHGAMK